QPAQKRPSRECSSSRVCRNRSLVETTSTRAKRGGAQRRLRPAGRGSIIDSAAPPSLLDPVRSCPVERGLVCPTKICTANSAKFKFVLFQKQSQPTSPIFGGITAGGKALWSVPFRTLL